MWLAPHSKGFFQKTAASPVFCCPKTKHATINRWAISPFRSDGRQAGFTIDSLARHPAVKAPGGQERPPGGLIAGAGPREYFSQFS
jgi:hypothetical protein